MAESRRSRRGRPGGAAEPAAPPGPPLYLPGAPSSAGYSFDDFPATARPADPYPAHPTTAGYPPPGPFERPERSRRSERSGRSEQQERPAPPGQEAEPPDDEPESDPVRRLVRLLGLTLLALTLLAWSLTTLIGDVAWGPLSVLPVGMASLSPFVVFAAVPLITVCLRHRRWMPILPALVAALLPWVFVLGYASPAPRPPGRTVPFRAMIVTAHNGAADPRDIVAAVKDQRADLVVVTELSDQLAHDLTAAGLAGTLTARYVTVPGSGSPEGGIGIYSRFPVDSIAPLPGTHWPAVTATVTVGQARFTLVAGHAVPPSVQQLGLWRRDLVVFRAAASIKGPVVELVNLNATPWHAQFRQLVSGRLHDAGDVLGRGLRPTWPAWSLPLLPTDHALVAGGVGVDSLDTVPVAGSDHRALVVAVSLPLS